jgi:tRNA-(ms[2]io[6]A)-hydroxylase
MKAATTALSLALKVHYDLDMVRILTELAKEELDHFERVVGFLARRGLELGQPSVDTYASELRKAASRLPTASTDPVVDRLLVGALIEARSCERFKLLLDNWPRPADRELFEFYRELFECEARHYSQYRDLALRAASTPPEGVEARLQQLASIEGELIMQLGQRSPTATVHG